MTSILTLNNVNYRIGKKDILQDVSFSLPEGEILALLGSNGAGKTTLMQLLLGLLKPTSGEITSCGFIPHKQGRKLRPLLGFVPAVPDVYDWMTPRELFGFLAPQYKTWDKEVAAQDSETLKVPLDTPFSKLSRGEAMKAMAVAAMSPHPRLLLLDEPFAGLDPTAREELLGTLLTRMEMKDQSILIATHNLEMAARLADRVVVLHEGKVTQEGLVEDLLPEQTPPVPMPKGLHELFQAGTQDPKELTQ